MRVLIRGGSIPAGYGVAKTYVDILKERYVPYGVEIINRSRVKETSFEGVETFYKDIDPFLPGILLLHFGTDDAFSSVYRSEFTENLVQIVRLARNRFNPVILLVTSHVLDNRYEMEAVNMYNGAIKEVAADLFCELFPSIPIGRVLSLHESFRIMISSNRTHAIPMRKDTKS